MLTALELMIALLVAEELTDKSRWLLPHFVGTLM
jgi:hypothetical protein